MQDKIADSLSKFVDISERKLDYLAAFLDTTTNYYQHTGTQSLARRLIERATNEIYEKEQSTCDTHELSFLPVS